MIIPAGGQDWKPDMGQASKPTSKDAKKDDGKENKAPGEKSKKQMEKEAKKAEKMAKRAAAKGDAGQVWSPIIQLAFYSQGSSSVFITIKHQRFASVVF